MNTPQNDTYEATKVFTPTRPASVTFVFLRNWAAHDTTSAVGLDCRLSKNQAA